MCRRLVENQSAFALGNCCLPAHRKTVRVTLFRKLFLAALLSGSLHVLWAQPATRLLTVSPAGGKSGAAVEVTVSGPEVTKAKEMRFSHAGIKATSKDTNRFEVTIAKDVPPGVYDVRLIGKYGASNPRAFAVGVLKEIAEAKNSKDTPQAIPLESAVNGQTETNTVDYYQFEAKAGQRVLVRCEDREIDSKLEPVLSLYDSAGREVSRARSGGLLDYAVKSDDTFTLRLHDVTYRGGTEYFYRLSIGTFPHIDFVQPLSAAEPAKFAVFGRNLPGGKSVGDKSGLERLEVELTRNDSSLVTPLVTMPAQAGLDLFEYRVRTELAISQPVLIRFPTADVVAEQEPNNTASNAMRITVPCEVTGKLHPNRDQDWFSFEATKGDVYWIEVLSHRLGSSSDPMVIVQRKTTNGMTDVLELNDGEANFGGPEFNTTHRDPSGKFEAKETGTYVIQLRDLFTHGKESPAVVYHLAIRKPAPDFKLVALPGNPLPPKKDAKDVGVTTTTLRRGETLPVKMMAFRRDGFDGPIELEAGDFPAGVSINSCRIDSGKNSALLFVTAENEATAAMVTATLRGNASIQGTNVSRVASPATVVWGTADPANEAAMARLTADSPLSIAEETAPVRVRPQSNIVETVANKTVKINFLIDRGASSAGNVKLKPYGLAALDSLAEVDVLEKETNLVLQIDLREKKVPVGTHAFALQVSPQAKTAADKSKKPKEPPPAFYSAPVVLKVAPAPAEQTNSAAK
jgi:hypothetical protein